MSRDGWPRADEIELRRLWDQTDPTLSAAKIAERMGRSKSSIIGKAHRLQLPSRPSPIIKGQASRPRAAIKPKVTLPPVLPELRPAIALEPEVRRALALRLAEQRVAPLPASEPESVPVAALLPAPTRLCCWPEGEPRTPSYQVCGAPRCRAWDGRELPYCPAHARRAYVDLRIAG